MKFKIACFFVISLLNYSVTISTNSIVSIPIQPTSLLLLNEKSRRQLSKKLNGKSFPYDNVIHGSLLEVLLKEDDELKKYYYEKFQEFNKIRHLSRYERKQGLRRRQKEEEVSVYQSAPLLQGLGTHYVTAWVGTPPQRQTLIVDTGSHYTAFPCVGCENCGEEYHTDNYFEPNKSKTFKSVNCEECSLPISKCSTDEGKCQFGAQYMEGSGWEAYESIDTFFIGSNLPLEINQSDKTFAIDFMFGCQYYCTGLFVSQHATGIMGLAGSNNIVSKGLENKLKHDKFSLCFGWELTVSDEGVYSGVMTLGGTDEALATNTSMVYATHIKSARPFSVFVRNVYLKDVINETTSSLEISSDDLNSGNRVIFDSGTTDIYFSEAIYNNFRKSWRLLTGFQYSDEEVKLTQKELEEYPTIVIQLSGVEELNQKVENNETARLAGLLDPDYPYDAILEIPPLHYMESLPQSSNYMSRLNFHEGSGAILGASAMRGHNILFDTENDMIGLAESPCNYADLLKATKETTKTKFVEKSEDKCKLSEPKLESYCWESVDKKEHCHRYSPNEKIVQGLSTYNAIVLETGPYVSCEEIAHTLLEDVILVQCFPEPYCDIVTTCETTCGEIVEKAAWNDTTRTNKKKASSLGPMRNVTHVLAEKSSDFFVMFIIFVFSALACCVFREDDEDDDITQSETSSFLMNSKTIEQAEPMDNQEMVKMDTKSQEEEEEEEEEESES